jgi:hypothetical protein
MIEIAKGDGKSVLYSLNAPHRTCNNETQAAHKKLAFGLPHKKSGGLVSCIRRLSRPWLLSCSDWFGFAVGHFLPLLYKPLEPGTVNLVTALSDA